MFVWSQIHVSKEEEAGRFVVASVLHSCSCFMHFLLHHKRHQMFIVGR